MKLKKELPLYPIRVDIIDELHPFQLPFLIDDNNKPKKKTKRIRGDFRCPQCDRSYIRKDSLQRHLTYECGKEPMFQCPFCPQKCKRKGHQIRHVRRRHKDKIGLLEENNPEMFSNKIISDDIARSYLIEAEDLRVSRTWENWPPHLILPMMLMRENMRKSMVETGSLDLTISKSNKVRSAIDGVAGSDGYVCNVCGRIYKLKSSLRNHQKWECGKEPQFKCPYCSYKAKQKMHMARHMERMHRAHDFSNVVKTELKEEKDESNEREADVNVNSQEGGEQTN